MTPNFFKRLLGSPRGGGGNPTQLNLPQAQPRDPAPLPGRQPEPKVLPGNFYFLPVFVELTLGDTVYPGYPKIAIFDTGNQVMRWGSKMEFSAPLPNSPKAPWIDDPELGVARRTLAGVEDVLGAEGTIGGMRYRFETILEQGKNIIVYGLYNPETRTRTAYGFNRMIFDGTLFRSGLLSHACAEWRRIRKTLFDNENRLGKVHRWTTKVHRWTTKVHRWTTKGLEEPAEVVQKLMKAREEAQAEVHQGAADLAQHESSCEACKAARQA